MLIIISQVWSTLGGMMRHSDLETHFYQQNPKNNALITVSETTRTMM